MIDFVGLEAAERHRRLNVIDYFVTPFQVDDCVTGEHDVRAPRKGAKHPPGVFRIARFPKNVSIENNHGVRAEDDSRRRLRENGSGFLECETADEIGR